MTTLIKKAMEIGFDKRVKPTGFLANLFKPENLDTIKVELQARSVKSIYAVDTRLGTGGRRIDLSGYDKEEFIVPEYNDFAVLTENDVFKAQFGDTEYTKVANIAKIINDAQEIISDMQTRAENKQAADALLLGYIVLADGTKIDFNKKSTHDITPSAKWSESDGTPITDLRTACALIINDGKLSVSEFNLILEDDGLAAFLANDEVKNNSSLIEGIKRTDINMPLENDQGAMFHGQISAGSYRINLWSYNDQYTIPTGYNFANEGTQVKYITSGKGLLLPMNPNFKKYYAAINNVNASSLLGGSKLQLVKTRQLPYSYDELIDGSAITKAGVKSRPLYVPIDVDSFVSFNTLV